MPNLAEFRDTAPLTMQCLSGFQLYCRWVPLVTGSYKGLMEPV